MKRTTFGSFLVTGEKPAYIGTVEVDKEMWLWGLINFLVMACYFSVKASAMSSAPMEAREHTVRGGR